MWVMTRRIRALILSPTNHGILTHFLSVGIKYYLYFLDGNRDLVSKGPGPEPHGEGGCRDSNSQVWGPRPAHRGWLANLNSTDKHSPKLVFAFASKKFAEGENQTYTIPPSFIASDNFSFIFNAWRT